MKFSPAFTKLGSKLYLSIISLGVVLISSPGFTTNTPTNWVMVCFSPVAIKSSSYSTVILIG